MRIPTVISNTADDLKGRSISENLKRIREPLAWLLIGVAVISVLLGLGRVVIDVSRGGTIFDAFTGEGSSLVNISVVLGVVLAVLLCLFTPPSTPRAMRITRVAAWVLTVCFLLTLAGNVLGLMAPQSTIFAVLDALGGLVDLLLKGLAAGALWVLLRGLVLGHIKRASSVTPVLPTPSAVKVRPAR